VLALPARSPASVWHVIEGAATLTVGEGAEAPRFALASADTACAPGYLPLTLANASADAPAFVFVADESPLHQKLGLYESR
jgi:gentisate 1,2-dioxygenase